MMFPDTMMPSFYKTEGFIRVGNGFSGKAAEGPVAPLLTAQQIEDVVAFLLTLKE
jgi:sulfur-oxidizing protein SoxX